MPSNVYCGYFRGYDTNERYILVDIDAFPNEVLPKSPHFVPTEVLILERKFYIFRLARILIKLGVGVLGAGIEWQNGLKVGLVAYLGDCDFPVVPDTENLGDISGDRYLAKRTEAASHRKT